MGGELFHADIDTDRNNETNSRVSQCCERAYKPHLTQSPRRYETINSCVWCGAGLRCHKWQYCILIQCSITVT